MAVDRGGLRYTITVEDKFSKNIARLKAQLKSLQGDLDRVSAARERATASSNQSTKATERATDVIDKDGKAQASAGRKTVAAQNKTQRALGGTRRELNRTSRAARRTASAVNRIGFSFRRLIGILAVFQGARAGVRLFTGAITGGIQFNRTIEDSTIAMAALFTTAGRVFDAQGNMLRGQEAFNRAIVIARDQTAKLRIDALGTIATFEELQRAFQGSVGPGLEAGLNVDQIRTFAVRISQAAGALGIAQNQLIEESRSFLRGTIQARTTLVASILGVSNKIVKEAKDSGRQVEFFKTILDGFRFSADATQQSLTGLIARLKDTFSQATGKAAEGFFDALKQSLADTSALFVTLGRNAKGVVVSLTPNPSAVAILRGVFDALTRGLDILQAGLRKIPIQELITSFIGLGGILESSVAIFTGFIQGGVQGFSILVGLVGIFSEEIGGLDVKNLESIGKSVGLISILLVGAGTAAAVLAGAMRLVKSPVTRIGGAIGLLVVGLKKVASEILQVNLTFADTGELIRLTFATAFGTVVKQGKIAFKAFANNLVGFFVDPIGTIAKMFGVLLTSLGGAAAILKSAGIISEESRISFEDSISALQALATERGKKSEGFFFSNAELAQDQDNLDKFIAEAGDKFVEFAAKVARAGADADVPFKLPELETGDVGGVTAQISAFAEGIAETLNGIIGANIVDVAGIKKAVADMVNDVVKGVGDATKLAETPIQKFAANIIKNWASGLAIVRAMTNQFASFVSDLIVDAFDPNKKVDIVERFAKLMQGIVKVIISELTKLAIAEAIISLGFKGAGKSGGGQAGGKAHGGQMHHVRGFDSGGTVPGGHHSTPQFRPASVAKSDTVAAWLTPKEFVHPVRSVNKYGADLMEMMRRGTIDPNSLRAVAGLGNKRASRIVSSSSSHRGGGYAAGGTVSDSDIRASQPASSGQVVGAVIPGNDRTMDRLLKGGKNSMLDFFQDNSSTIDSILSKNRTR